MARQSNKLNPEVSDFLDAQQHPFRKEIEQLRGYILSADKNLEEHVKWNGPNYSLTGADWITMRIQPPKKQVQLIFHRGAAKLAQPKEKLIAHAGNLLVWKENDRAIITFKSMQEIEQAREELMAIIQLWVKAAK